LVEIIENSDADFLILGGDFNFDAKTNSKYRPKGNPESTHADLEGVLTNSMKEHLTTNEVEAHMNTYANPENQYSKNKKQPELLDYIFYKAKNGHMMKTKDYKVPLLKTKDGLNLSDHEAVVTNFELIVNKSKAT